MTKTQVIKESNGESKKENKSYKIEVEHIYLLSAIADKIDFKLPEFPDYHEEQIKLIAKGNNKLQVESKIKAMQFKYGKDLMLMLFKSMHKAKDEINKLIKEVTKKEPAEMGLKELKDCFTDILNTEGVMDFFR